MGWKDKHGRPEIFMHPDIVTGDADWRLVDDEQGAAAGAGDSGGGGDQVGAAAKGTT